MRVTSSYSHKKMSDPSNLGIIEEGVWSSMDERKRPYTSSLLDSKVDELNEEQLEAYRLKRLHTADPMRDYMSKDH